MLHNKIMDKKLKNIKGIYKLTIANHIYIGSSVNLYKRLSSHFNSLKSNNHDNEYLQRCVNKYGIENLKWEIVEIEDDNIEYVYLLQREKYFIEYFHADLNLKLDPVTQNNCITTSKKVYQFSQFGELIREWPSVAEASRRLNIDASNITVACLKRSRQRIAAGFLWDFSNTYTGEINIIYVFDLNGNFLGKYKDTIDIYLNFFKDKKRKTVLSQLRKKIDKNIPYENIYLSTNINFKINPNYKPKFHEKTELELLLSKNPTIYHFDKNGNLLEYKRFKEYKHPTYIKRSLISKKHSKCFYSLNKFPTFNPCSHQRCKPVIAINVDTKEVHHFKSLKECGVLLLNEKNGYNIKRYLLKNTPYKGYIFKWDSL